MLSDEIILLLQKQVLEDIYIEPYKCVAGHELLLVDHP